MIYGPGMSHLGKTIRRDSRVRDLKCWLPFAIIIYCNIEWNIVNGYFFFSIFVCAWRIKKGHTIQMFVTDATYWFVKMNKSGQFNLSSAVGNCK